MPGSGNTLGYLPDGRQIIPPEDGTQFPVFQNRVPARTLTHDVGQIGYWYAQPLLFIGLSTAAQTIATSTWTSIPLNAELVDNYETHSNVTTNYEMQPPLTGNTVFYASTPDLYLNISYMAWGSTDTTSVFVTGCFNTVAANTFEGTKVPGITGHGNTGIHVDLQFFIGNPGVDYLSLAGWQNTGANASTVVTSKCPTFTVQWVGSNRAFTSVVLPSPPHTWIDQDEIVIGATPPYPAGPVSPGVQVDLNREVYNPLEFFYSRPMARVTSQASTQTVAASAWTSIQMPTSVVDFWGMWATGSNTRLTCQVAGLYLIAGYASLSETSTKTGYRAVRLLVNGTTVYGGTTAACMTGTKTTGIALYAFDLIQMAVGDYVEVQFFHTNGSALTVNTGTGNGSRLIALWMCN